MSERGMIPPGRSRMTIEGNTTKIEFGLPEGGRQCGDCQLCCKLVPVPTIDKPAGKRCTYQRTGKGCRIYADRPFSCASWSCRWLIDPEAAGLARPDRSHCVVDITDDYIELAPHDGGPVQRVGVVQIWVDPAFPDAWQAPPIRAYVEAMAQRHRMATIFRWSSSQAMTQFAPCLSADGAWHELWNGTIRPRDEIERKVVALG